MSVHLYKLHYTCGFFLSTIWNPYMWPEWICWKSTFALSGSPLGPICFSPKSRCWHSLTSTNPPPLSPRASSVSAGKANPFRGDPPLEKQHPHHDRGHAFARLLLWRRVPPKRPHQRPGHQTRCFTAGEMDPAASSKTVRPMRSLFSCFKRGQR